MAIFQPDYVGDFYVARGIVWAVNNGAQVLNNSWGGLGYGQLVKEAFDYALANGVVVVASAGNSYKDEVRTPAGYPGIIASAAADGNRNKTDFSTYGRHISSAAPAWTSSWPTPPGSGAATASSPERPSPAPTPPRRPPW